MRRPLLLWLLLCCWCGWVRCGDLTAALDTVLARAEVPLARGLSLRRVEGTDSDSGVEGSDSGHPVLDRLQRLARTRVLDVRVPELVDEARTLLKSVPRFSFGKNSFLTGFGLGFLAFGLKKLLLPLFIGAQVVKSVLLAMFLPSIIGSVAKLMGKGLTSVAQSSSSSTAGAGAGQDTITDFDFKDTGGGGGGGGYDSLGAGSDDANAGVWTYPPDSSARHPFPAYTSSGLGVTSSALRQQQQQQQASDRYQKFSYHDTLGAGLGLKHAYPHAHGHGQGSFYSQDKRQDFKVFHNIPASSHLLAHYDPFYSPLLSRLDSVFQQLGRRGEACRERLVCDMYNSPARYAPFSNLVSAQLSRELNELRKPSTDNPEILRFFRYMKAAKDGQDGVECERVYSGCAVGVEPPRAPMVTTFNDINKLVHARKLDV